MNLTGNAILNVYSILLLAVVYLHARKHSDNNTLQEKLFLMILVVTALALAIDIFSRFDGNPGTAFPLINRVGNYLIFLINPVIASLWYLYVHSQVYRDDKRTKRLLGVLATLWAVNAALVTLSQFFGWFYTIDGNNIYHRGDVFWLPACITLGLIVTSFLLIAFNREKIERKHLFSLLFFPVPPLAGILLQVLFYGVPFMLNCLVLSILIVYFSIQNRSLYTDYLTGAYNRKRLESYMRAKIVECTENRTFSAILIDLDNFKSINDTHGHDMGDDALESAARLLKSCVRSCDFVARFGGDEFCVVLDTSTQADLESAVARIKSQLSRYNDTSSKPYILGFSMGYAVYDAHSRMNAEDFEKKIDRLMYENKRSRQATPA